MTDSKPSETHPMDYYGRIRELEARVAELEADQHCPTCGSSVYTCVDCDVTPLRVCVAELEADAYDTARAEGVAAERARVVAHLRSVGAIVAADEIERGEHDKEGT